MKSPDGVLFQWIGGCSENCQGIAVSRIIVNGAVVLDPLNVSVLKTGEKGFVVLFVPGPPIFENEQIVGWEAREGGDRFRFLYGNVEFYYENQS